MNLQVIDLIEGFDMDVVYDCDTQLDKPIVFAGAGFYSMNDAGVFVFDHERRPSMPTYSRIKVTDPDAKVAKKTERETTRVLAQLLQRRIKV
jgi:hypothetical protein